MKKEEFEQKIQSAQPSVKAEKAYAITKQSKLGKVFRAIKVGAITFAMAAAMAFNAMAMAACDPKPTPTPDPPKPPITVPEDKDKEAQEALARGTALFEAEIDKIETNKNFTYNDGSKNYLVDGDTLKIGEDYIVKENGTLYKLSKQEDGKYHKQTTDENDASQVLSALLEKVDDLTFTKYDEATKTLTANGITIKVDNGLTIKIGNKIHTVTDINETTVTLPNEIVDDTKPPELTEEEKQAIVVQNLYKAVEEKLFEKVGSNINKIMALDYGKGDNGSNYVYMFVENTNEMEHKIDLLRFPMATEMTEENVMSGNIKTNQYSATTLLSMNANVFDTKNDEKSNAIYNKLKSEQLVKSDNPTINCYSTSTAGATEIGGCHSVRLYSLSSKAIEAKGFLVKSDGNIQDYITESLINGTLDKTFIKSNSSESNFYFEFSNNAIVDYEGLPFEKQEEENKTTPTTSARVMVGDQLFAIKRGNQTTYFDLYNEENSEY